jgi:hypothetical protein
MNATFPFTAKALPPCAKSYLRLIQGNAVADDFDAKREHIPLLTDVFSYQFKGPSGQVIDEMVLPDKLAHYTTAQAAFDIISARDDKRCLWLRNATVMNDFKELSYGQEMIVEAFADPHFEKAFNKAYQALAPNSAPVATLMENGLEDIRRNTFLLSLSRHSPEELKSGRLSMWRAYGGTTNVALVFDLEALYVGSYAWPVILSPVMYFGVEEVRGEFERILAAMLARKDELSRVPPHLIEAELKESLETLLLTTKHPGFAEEEEWRLIHRQEAVEPVGDFDPSEIPSKIVCLSGIVQKVYYLPMRRPGETEVTSEGLSDLLTRIIIGPTSNEALVRDGFVQLLEEAGLTDADQRVLVSGIPLRR